MLVIHLDEAIFKGDLSLAGEVEVIVRGGALALVKALAPGSQEESHAWVVRVPQSHGGSALGGSAIESGLEFEAEAAIEEHDVLGEEFALLGESGVDCEAMSFPSLGCPIENLHGIGFDHITAEVMVKDSGPLKIFQQWSVSVGGERELSCQRDVPQCEREAFVESECNVA